MSAAGKDAALGMTRSSVLDQVGRERLNERAVLEPEGIQDQLFQDIGIRS